MRRLECRRDEASCKREDQAAHFLEGAPRVQPVQTCSCLQRDACKTQPLRMFVIFCDNHNDADFFTYLRL